MEQRRWWLFAAFCPKVVKPSHLPPFNFPVTFLQAVIVNVSGKLDCVDEMVRDFACTCYQSFSNCCLLRYTLYTAKRFLHLFPIVPTNEHIFIDFGNRSVSATSEEDGKDFGHRSERPRTYARTFLQRLRRRFQVRRWLGFSRLLHHTCSSLVAKDEVFIIYFTWPWRWSAPLCLACSVIQCHTCSHNLFEIPLFPLRLFFLLPAFWSLRSTGQPWISSRIGVKKSARMLNFITMKIGTLYLPIIWYSRHMPPSTVEFITLFLSVLLWHPLDMSKSMRIC